MNVFLSWSGERSKRVANMLSDWLSCVIQTCRPWVSTRDIDRGSLWFSEINDKLQTTSIGVICLTKENKERPWILFEAGALAKGLNGSRVCTLLIDLTPGEITDPLAQFNHTVPQKESIYQLVQTLNSSLATGGLNEAVLLKVFETYWPQFESEFEKIIKDTQQNEPGKESKNNPSDVSIANVLDLLQTMNGRLRRIEEDRLFIRNKKYIFNLDNQIDTTTPSLENLAKKLASDGTPHEYAFDLLVNAAKGDTNAAKQVFLRYFK